MDDDDVEGDDPEAPPPPDVPPALWACAAAAPVSARLTATAIRPTLFINTPGGWNPEHAGRFANAIPMTRIGLLFVADRA